MAYLRRAVAVRRHDAQVGVCLGEEDGHTVGGPDDECPDCDVVQCPLDRAAGQQVPVDLGNRLEQLLAALALVVEASVLDRDSRGDGERADQLFVDFGELLGALLLGEVEVAEDLVAHAHRHAEERRHRRVVGRKPERVRVLREVREPQRSRITDQQAQDAVALGFVSDARPHLVVDSDGHELDQMVTIGTDDSERPVLGVGEPARTLHDRAQHRWKVEPGPDREHGLEQDAEPVGRRRDDDGPLLELA